MVCQKSFKACLTLVDVATFIIGCKKACILRYIVKDAEWHCSKKACIFKDAQWQCYGKANTYTI